MVPYLLDAQSGSAASTLEDILSSAEGPQEGSMILGWPTNWYMVLATFRPAGASTTTTSPSSTTTTSPTPTSTTTSSTTTTKPPPTPSTTTSTSTTTTTTLPGTTTGLSSSAHPSVFGQ